MATRLHKEQQNRMYNKSAMSAVKTIKKKFLILIEKKEFDNASSIFINLESQIQRLGNKGILHKNTASRLISRLALKLVRR